MSMASDKQIALIRRLAEERNISDEYPDSLLATLTGGFQGTASQHISRLFLIPKPRKETDVTEPGMYLMGDEIFKVQKSRERGNLYAKKLIPGEYGHASFDYAPGVVSKLTKDMLMTLEQALALSALYGTCVRCGRTLSDPKSVRRSIGPVCIKYFH